MDLDAFRWLLTAPATRCWSGPRRCRRGVVLAAADAAPAGVGRAGRGRADPGRAAGRGAPSRRPGRPDVLHPDGLQQAHPARVAHAPGRAARGGFTAPWSTSAAASAATWWPACRAHRGRCRPRPGQRAVARPTSPPSARRRREVADATTVDWRGFGRPSPTRPAYGAGSAPSVDGWTPPWPLSSGCCAATPASRSPRASPTTWSPTASRRSGSATPAR